MGCQVAQTTVMTRPSCSAWVDDLAEHLPRCAILQTSDLADDQKQEAMALDGMAAFRARFDHSLAISAGVEAERQRIEQEIKRVAQEQEVERVRELHRQQTAQEARARQARERMAPAPDQASLQIGIMTAQTSACERAVGYE
jgi:GTP cyclohydrolase III